MRKRILIKASGILLPKKGKYISGIGRSNLALIKGFEKINDPDLEFILYDQSPRRPFYAENSQRFSYKLYNYLLPEKWFYFTNFESIWRKLNFKYDLLHITRNFGSVSKDDNFVLTTHDIYMYNEYPKYQKIFENSIYYSKAIVTCSEFTKQDIVQFFKVNPNKITVIPWGIDHDLFYPRSAQQIEETKKRFGIPGDYFFACSCFHPRKNADTILAGFRIFMKENKDATLVLTLSNPPKHILDEYSKEINEGRIKLLDFVSDEDLATLYSGALASFLVSSFEGFGFPILESMACGTPCITCRNSSLEEVGKDKAYYVRERNAEDITQALHYFTQYGKGDVESLKSYAKTFNWDSTTRQYIDFYKANL